MCSRNRANFRYFETFLLKLCFCDDIITAGRNDAILKNLHELLTFWLENYKRGFVSIKTYQCCLYIAGLIKKNTEDMPIVTFDDVYVNALILKLFDKGYSKSTLSKVKSVISRTYSVAVKKGFTNINPCAEAIIPVSTPVK